MKYETWNDDMLGLNLWALKIRIVLQPIIYMIQIPSLVVPHPLTVKLAPTGVTAVGKAAAWTYELKTNGVFTSKMAMSKFNAVVLKAILPAVR